MSDYDSFLDGELEKYYEDTEEDVVDENDWMIDKYIEDQIRAEDWFDEYESY